MKTYVLTLSRTFPKGHPREGEWTDFRQAVENALTLPRRGDAPWKCHTVRENYELWKKRIEDVNAGEAVLSVRQWEGEPRRSKQEELFRLGWNSGIGVERLELSKSGDIAVYRDNERGYWIKRRRVEVETLAGNDGLSVEDWRAWFKGHDRSKPMAVIHFTPFRYCK